MHLRVLLLSEWVQERQVLLGQADLLWTKWPPWRVREGLGMCQVCPRLWWSLCFPEHSPGESCWAFIKDLGEGIQGTLSTGLDENWSAGVLKSSAEPLGGSGSVPTVWIDHFPWILGFGSAPHPWEKGFAVKGWDREGIWCLNLFLLSLFPPHPAKDGDSPWPTFACWCIYRNIFIVLYSNNQVKF